MLPTLKDGDRVLVVRDWPKSWLRKNDIVLIKPFLSMEQTNQRSYILYVKRLVGFPNDVIDVNHNVFVELEQGIKKDVINVKQWIIPKGYFFVQGDSNYSLDSREWGPIPACNIIGKIIYKLYS